MPATKTEVEKSVCRDCNCALTADNTPKNYLKTHTYWCTDCRRMYLRRRAHSVELKEKMLEKQRSDRKVYMTKVKNDVFSAYGNKCACCDEIRREFLTIDHMDGNGCLQRKQRGWSGDRIYIWLRLNKFPDRFQILCMNCNSALGRFGYCPHRPEMKRPILQNRREYKIIKPGSLGAKPKTLGPNFGKGEAESH